MNDRIYGSETELISIPPNFFGHAPNSRSFLIEKFFEVLRRKAGFSAFTRQAAPYGFFSGMMGRCYLDGSLLELSTPECRNPLEVLLYEKAQEQALMEAVRSFNEQTYFEEELCLYKHSLTIPSSEKEFEAHSSGYHANFLVPRDEELWKRLKNILPAFLVSSMIWTGAGLAARHCRRAPFCKNRDKRLHHFVLSQRAIVLTELFASGTTAGRAIFNEKDEPLADAEKWRRFHCIAKDKNMSEFAIWLFYSVMGIIITMIEEGFLEAAEFYIRDANYPDAPDTKSPSVLALWMFAHDISFSHEVVMGGRSVNAIAIQELFLKRACAFYAGSSRLTPDVATVLYWWGEILEALKRNNIEELSYYCDWAMNLRLLQRDMEKHGYGWETPYNETLRIHTARRDVRVRAGAQLKYNELKYFLLSPERGRWHHLRKHGYLFSILSDADIEKARWGPPQNTRAFARHQCIQWIEREKYRRTISKIEVEWDTVILNDLKDSAISFPNPFDSSAAAAIQCAEKLFPIIKKNRIADI